jgi:hypothetical protein
MNFHESFHWLDENHEWAISQLTVGVYESPKEGIYLETGSLEKGSAHPTHDLDLDVDADTFEEGIVKLAELVRKHYGERTDIFGEPTNE